MRDAPNAEGRTALHVALEHNNRTTEQLIKRGATVDICAAAALARLARLRELLDSDPELANDRTTHLSPLGWAAFFCAADSAELLIARGARMDDGELLCAAMVAAVPIASILLQHGYDIDSRNDEDGATALHFAVSHRHTRDSSAFIGLLLEQGADPAICTTRKALTALDLARQRLEEQSSRGVTRDDPGWKNFAGAVALLDDAG